MRESYFLLVTLTKLLEASVGSDVTKVIKGKDESKGIKKPVIDKSKASMGPF